MMYTAAAIPTGLVGMHSDRPPGNDCLCSEQLPFIKGCVGKELNEQLVIPWNKCGNIGLS